MTHAEQQRLDAAVAPANHIHRPEREMVDQRRQIVGHLLVGDGTVAVRRASVVAAVHRDDFAVRPEEIDLRRHRADALPLPWTSRSGSPVPYVSKYSLTPSWVKVPLAVAFAP